MSFLVWFGATGAVIGVVVALMAVCCFPSCRSTFRVFNMVKDLAAALDSPSSQHLEQSGHAEADETGGEDDAVVGNHSSEYGLTGTKNSEGVFQVCVTYRTTKATDCLCWFMFGVKIGLLFLYPLIALCRNREYFSNPWEFFRSIDTI